MGEEPQQAAETVRSATLPDDLLELKRGSRIGRYELLEVLGHGGFGITYRARDLELRRDVAIKEYLPSSFAFRRPDGSVVPRSAQAAETFDWGRDRFAEEARTLARLERVPGVVNVYDIITTNGTAYMVMEYIQGETLEARLRSAGTLDQKAIEQLLPPLLTGLELVHEAGFLHRDIKPSNILIDRNERPSLIDFGASRMALEGRTQTLTAVYTPGYAAFEQLTSAKQGPPADIYAFGATLYHAVTGKAPPGANDRMIDDRLVPATTAGRGRYSSRLLAAIDASLRLRAVDRPQTIEAWRKLLDTTAGPLGGKRRSMPWVLVGSVVVGISVAGALAWNWLPPGPTSSSSVADQERIRLEEAARRAREEAVQRAEEERRKAAADKEEREKADRDRVVREEAARRAEEERRRVAAEKAAREKAEQERAAREEASRADEERRKSAADKATARPVDRPTVADTSRQLVSFDDLFVQLPGSHSFDDLKFVSLSPVLAPSAWQSNIEWHMTWVAPYIVSGSRLVYFRFPRDSSLMEPMASVGHEPTARVMIVSPAQSPLTEQMVDAATRWVRGPGSATHLRAAEPTVEWRSLQLNRPYPSRFEYSKASLHPYIIACPKGCDDATIEKARRWIQDGARRLVPAAGQDPQAALTPKARDIGPSLYVIANHSPQSAQQVGLSIPLSIGYWAEVAKLGRGILASAKPSYGRRAIGMWNESRIRLLDETLLGNRGNPADLPNDIHVRSRDLAGQTPFDFQVNLEDAVQFMSGGQQQELPRDARILVAGSRLGPGGTACHTLNSLPSLRYVEIFKRARARIVFVELAAVTPNNTEFVTGRGVGGLFRCKTLPDWKDIAESYVLTTDLGVAPMLIEPNFEVLRKFIEAFFAGGLEN